MFNADTDILFPLRVIPFLDDLRGETWQALIHRLSKPQVTDVELSAFTLMMARLCGCAACNIDSFRAMKGCTQCTRLVVRRNKNLDADMVNMYMACLDEVEDYFKRHLAKNS